MNRKIVMIAFLSLGILFVAGYVLFWPPTTSKVEADPTQPQTVLVLESRVSKLETRMLDAEKDVVTLQLMCVENGEEWKELASWREEVDITLADHEQRLQNHEGRITQLERCVKCDAKSAKKKSDKLKKSGKTSGSASFGHSKKAKGVQPLPLITAEKVQMNADICGNPEVTSLPVITEVLGPDDPGRLVTIGFLEERYPLFQLKNAVVVKAVTVVEVP